jgi:co-chaperonin GroES (HSP10)
LGRYEKKNDCFKYLLACVDVFTRKAYVEPMKGKDSIDCTEAFKAILARSKVKPKAMFSDQDPAYSADPFAKFAKEQEITLNDNAHSDHRALGIIDNFAKRIKLTLTRRFGDQKSVSWVPIIQEVVSNYNKMETKALDGIAPDKATEEKNQSKILNQNMEKQPFNKANVDVAVGDRVRKSTRGSKELNKGTDPIWSDDIFKVSKVEGNTVKLEDGSTYKRTDLLIVPPGSESTVHPVNAQKKENTLEKQRLNKEKEAAYKEKHPERAAQPRIRIEPVPPPPKPAPMLAIEDRKPAIVAPAPKAAMSSLISQQKANYVPAKTREQARQERERREAATKAAKKAEAERAARVRKQIADEVKAERARTNKEIRR